MNKKLFFNPAAAGYGLIGILALMMGCAQSPRYQPMEWKVGQWTDYEFNGKPIKISIVAEDSIKKLFWVETAEPEIVVKFLVSEHNLNLPKRLIVKKLGGAPVEFPIDRFSVSSQLPTVKIDGSVMPKKELLTLECGKFKAFHFTQEDKDIWLANNVPILGIVKSTSKSENFVLRAFGIKGASSEISDEARVSEFIG